MSVRKWGFAILWVGVTVLPGWFALPARGATRTHESSVDPKVEAAISAVKLALGQMRETVVNEFGRTIPKMASPQEVVDAVDRIEGILADSKSAKLQNSSLVRDVYLEAIYLLYAGRGRTNKATEDGWYLARSGGRDSGLDEIRELIVRGRLDVTGKEKLRATITLFEADTPASRTARGFPANRVTHQEDSAKTVLNLLDKAKTAPDSESLLTLTGKLPTLAELIEASSMAGDEKKSFREKFLPKLERIFYDKSAAIVNDPTKAFVHYFGRDDETRLTVNTLSRIEKGHVLLTGKAGVGKTTIMQILSDGFINGRFQLRDEPPPIVLELSIVDVTNPSDPSEIKARIAGAKRLAAALNRRVILYIDEAHIMSPMVRNATKSFLTEKLLVDENQVHMVISTTSGEARDFLSDTAFSRRFGEVNVVEFDKAQTIQLIRQTTLPLWQREHSWGGLTLEGISDEAYDYAFENAVLEQPHSANPTGTKELLEGVITTEINARRERGEVGAITINVPLIRQYLKAKLRIDLLPGDPDFDQRFEEKWAAFEAEYVGNPGAKIELKRALKRHLGSLKRRKMLALAIFGPPGGGKSYLAELIAKHFFGGASAVLTINGGEFRNGGLEINKLIGSPTGTVGSEQQRSMLTKFMADNPRGGVIKIEEADYKHQDVDQLLTNMITDLKFTDGIGKEWATGQYIIFANSNIGQELMIPSDTQNTMNWEQYQTRRNALTERVSVEGAEVEVVRADKLDRVFEQYIHEIVTKSNPGGDTSAVSQEAAKQRRRYTPIYILTPNREELLAAAQAKIRSFVARAQREYQVAFTVAPELVERILDLDHFQFEKGYSYVDERFERLFDILAEYYTETGAQVTVNIEYGALQTSHGEEPQPTLVVQVGQAPANLHPLPVRVVRGDNPWANSAEMRERIQNFVPAMRKTLRANNRQIEETADQLKLKLIRWDTPVVLTQLGTTGNGKTQFFHSMALALFDDPKAVFTISGLNNKFQLGNYFRPPTGIQGGTQETEFEKWFKSRQNAGGGIILLDELLSISGLAPEQIANRIEIINELYDLLDIGVIKFGNKQYDARGFVIGITGNALQELFAGLPDDPDSERLIRRTIEKTSRNDIVKYLNERGFDPPKTARLGKLFLNGPLPKSETYHIGHIMLAKGVAEMRKSTRGLEVDVAAEVVQGVVDKLTTLQLGMREVNKGFDQIILTPISGMLADIAGVKKIEARVDAAGIIHWWVNGKPVIRRGQKVDASGIEVRTWVYADGVVLGEGVVNRTPQVSDLKEPDKVKSTPEEIRMIAIHEVIGHWMTHVMLTGHNPSEAISLVPGEGYLGYVMPKEEEIRGLMSLTTLMTRVAMLEAGHRSVFIMAKTFATGGGTADAKAKKRNDDVKKTIVAFETIINNQILDRYTELSSGQEQNFVKSALKQIGLGMADYIVEKGLASGQFMPTFERVMAERFLNSDILEQAVGQIDWSGIGSPEQNYLEAMIASALAYMESQKDEGKTLKRRDALVRDLVQRSAIELKARTAINAPERSGEVSAVVDRLMADFLTRISDGECGPLLTRGGSGAQ